MAVMALTFLAADDDRLERFLSCTGLGPHNLRGAAAGPQFYGSVLGYLIADEPLLLQFAAQAGLRPEEVVRVLEGLEPRPVVNS
jgi:hypothetical protein